MHARLNLCYCEEKPILKEVMLWTLVHLSTCTTLIITLPNVAFIHNAMHSPTFLSFHVALYPTKQYIRNSVLHKIQCLLYKQ